MIKEKAKRKKYPIGRMLRDIYSRDEEFASMAVKSRLLFLMLIPHFDPHGKFQGGPNVIKGLVLPFMDDYDTETIEKCLLEINEKTNLKWFKHEGLMYLQFLDWNEHQELREDRLGADRLPTYPGITEYKENELKDKKYKLLREHSGSNPGVLPREVEVEGEVEVEVEVEVEGEEEVQEDNKLKSTSDLSNSSNSEVEEEAKHNSKCEECGEKPAKTDKGLCLFCHAKEYGYESPTEIDGEPTPST